MFSRLSLVLRSWIMPVPLAPPITLAHDEQSRLESIVRAHSTPQALAFRCQLILRAAASDCPSNLQVANELHCNRHTVSRWRHRYLAHGLNGLQDALRSGRPRRFSPLRNWPTINPRFTYIQEQRGSSTWAGNRQRRFS